MARRVVLVNGDGAWVTDDAGRRYLDASAALWYCNVGHGRRELAEAASAQMTALETYQLFDVFATQPALDLADRLVGLAPTGPRSAVFFTSGGSDSVDTAAKIARRYWNLLGLPEKRIIIAREGAYHGMHGFGTSLAGITANAAGWGPLIAEVIHIERDDPGALARALEAHKGRVAAFIGEPVQGAAGVFPPPPGYWPAVTDLCREHEVLLIADEVISGFGRLGEWFGSSRYRITPDLVTCAKGLSSGYLPIGAVLAARPVVDVLWSDEAGAFRHGYTYSGHATACAVASENLDIIERERLVERVAALEPALAKALAPLAAHALVDEVRTVGLLGAIAISAEARTTWPLLTERVMDEVRERGVLVRNLVGASLQISPPFIIDEEELRLIAATISDALDAVATRYAAQDFGRTAAL
jgi:putrescine---pyruvate transaminase